MSTAANQQPVTVVNPPMSGEFPTVTRTSKVQPLVATDGGDGTRTTAATKLADNVWTPFRAETDAAAATPAPATRLATTGDDTAVIAAGLAKI